MTGPGTGRGRNGVVLVAVLVVAALATAMVTEFAYRISLDLSRAAARSAARRASLLARSGITAAAVFARRMYATQEYTHPGRYTMVLPEPFPGRPGTISITIEDENGKVNLNGVVRENGDEDPGGMATLQHLLEELSLDPDLALRIKDWVDPDSIAEGSAGVEGTAPNAPLLSIEELGNVPGFTPDMVAALRPHVTVYTRRPGSLEEEELNLNAASEEVLRALSVESGNEVIRAFLPDEVDRILRERTIAPLAEDWNSRLGQLSNHSKIYTKVDVKGSVFQVTSTGQVNEVKRIIEAVVDVAHDLEILSWREY